MRRVGQVRRRDANEKAIVDALRAVGAHVTRISGDGAPDILVRHAGGRLWAFEVKSAKGKQTEAQQETDWPILRTVDEALAAIGATSTTRDVHA
jgi:Holliday junction resolvase